MTHGRLATLAALVVLSACAHAHSHGSATGLPPGCDKSIAGTWVHEDNATYQYSVTDDGKSVHMIPHRVNLDGSLILSDALDTSPIDIALERKEDGFSGDFRMFQTLDTGATCGVLFLARITACSPDRLVMEIEQSYAMNPSCQRIDFGQSDLVRHVLIRTKP